MGSLPSLRYDMHIDGVVFHTAHMDEDVYHTAG